MKQWQHIFFKYSRYEPCGVVLRCLPSEQAVGFGNFKKKSEGKPIGLDLLGNFKWILWANGSILSLEIITGNRFQFDLKVVLANKHSFQWFLRKLGVIDVGPGPMGLDLLEIWSNILTKRACVMSWHTYGCPPKDIRQLYICRFHFWRVLDPPWPPLTSPWPQPLAPKPLFLPCPTHIDNFCID